MKPLKIGITGVRGVVGETLTPELIVEFASAFGSYIGSGKVLVGRDTRPSGPMAAAAVCAGLLATGLEVIDLGICPTPSLQLAVKRLGAAGGISITGGHNPSQWNALKFVRADGLYLNGTQAEELLDIFHQGEFEKAGWESIYPAISHYDAIPGHIAALRAAFDTTSIRSRNLVVAVDCCNGACSLLSPTWLGELGCRVLAINDDPSSPFPHNPEPKPAAMAQLRAVVKAGQADIGFSHDANGERLGIVTGDGQTLSEEATLAIAAMIRLSRKAGNIVTHVSTSSMVDLIASRAGGNVIRTPVGQAYISEAMMENNAILGGEGNGAVVVPEVHCTNDSAAAIGLILEHMALTGESIAVLAARLPVMHMLKKSILFEPHLIYSKLNKLREEALEAEATEVDLSDGIRLSWAEGWLHVRASNTESMIRVITESSDERRAMELQDWAIDRLR